MKGCAKRMHAIKNYYNLIQKQYKTWIVFNKTISKIYFRLIYFNKCQLKLKTRSDFKLNWVRDNLMWPI
jgi:hypothetical protein